MPFWDGTWKLFLANKLFIKVLYSLPKLLYFLLIYLEANMHEYIMLCLSIVECSRECFSIYTSILIGLSWYWSQCNCLNFSQNSKNTTTKRQKAIYFNSIVFFHNRKKLFIKIISAWNNIYWKISSKLFFFLGYTVE